MIVFDDKFKEEIKRELELIANQLLEANTLVEITDLVITATEDIIKDWLNKQGLRDLKVWYTAGKFSEVEGNRVEIVVNIGKHWPNVLATMYFTIFPDGEVKAHYETT